MEKKGWTFANIQPQMQGNRLFETLMQSTTLAEIIDRDNIISNGIKDSFDFDVGGNLLPKVFSITFL